MELEKLERFRDYYNKQEGQRYPCSNQVVLCGIITHDRDKAETIMAEKGAVKILKMKGSNGWNLNDERWMWRKQWGENTRGFRFYKLIIDKNIDEETFDFVNRLANLYCCSIEIM